MAHIRLDDKEIELSVGGLYIGGDVDGGVRFGAVPERGNLALSTVDSRGSATVRRAASAVTVLVNSVALGAEPAPLLHGDRIEVAGRQLRFSDDRKAGSTVLVPAFAASARTGDAQPLCRGDIIRIGGEELRFFADESPASAASPATLDIRPPSRIAPEIQ